MTNDLLFEMCDIVRSILEPHGWKIKYQNVFECVLSNTRGKHIKIRIVVSSVCVTWVYDKVCGMDDTHHSFGDLDYADPKFLEQVAWLAVNKRGLNAPAI